MHPTFFQAALTYHPRTRVGLSDMPTELFVDMLEHLDLTDIISLMKVSKTFRAHCREWTRLRIRAFFERYGLPADPFLRMLDHTGSVVSGYGVLYFLLRKATPDSHTSLNIFTTPERCSDVAETLKASGFRVLNIPAIHINVNRSGLRSVIPFFKHQAGVDAPLVMNVMVTRGRDVLLPFVKCFSTAGMTFITAKSIHSVYPLLTFNNRAILPKSRLTMPQLWKALPAHLGQALGVHPDGMLAKLEADEFDVRTAFSWPDEDCGTACGVVQNSVASRSGFHLVYDPSPSSLANGGRDFSGSDVRFCLTGTCYNRRCENYCQTHASTFGTSW